MMPPDSKLSICIEWRRMSRTSLSKRIQGHGAGVAGVGALLLWSFPAQAQQGAANLFHEVHYSLSGNVTVVNDYLFRGKSSSDGKPAIQGGFDYTGIQSVFLGAWGSSGSRSVPVEFDLYGGIDSGLNDWSSLELAVTAYLYPHVMDQSTWESKLQLQVGTAAIAYQYDFVLKRHYPEAGYLGEVRSWLAYRVRVGISHQVQGMHARPGAEAPVEQTKNVWDGDAQLFFTFTAEFAANIGVVYHEEEGTTALFGVRTEFDFLSWR